MSSSKQESEAPFRIKVKRICEATCYKSALYEIEYAPGVFTNVYADNAKAARAAIGNWREDPKP